MSRAGFACAVGVGPLSCFVMLRGVTYDTRRARLPFSSVRDLPHGDQEADPVEARRVRTLLVASGQGYGVSSNAGDSCTTGTPTHWREA